MLVLYVAKHTHNTLSKDVYTRDILEQDMLSISLWLKTVYIIVLVQKYGSQ